MMATGHRERRVMGAEARVTTGETKGLSAGAGVATGEAERWMPGSERPPADAGGRRT